MNKRVLVIAILALILISAVIAQPLAGIAEKSAVGKRLVKTRILEKLQHLPKEKRELLENLKPAKLRILNALKSDDIKKFAELDPKHLEKIKKLKARHLAKLGKLDKQVLQKIADLPEEAMKKVTKLKVARLKKLANTKLLQHAKQLKEEHMWRLSELRTDELKKIENIDEKALKKLAKLPAPLLRRVVAELPKEVLESEELNEEDLEKLAEVPPEKLEKLKGLEPAKIKYIIAKLPRLSEAKRRYLIAKERYLLAKERYLAAKEMFLEAKHKMLELKERFRQASPEDKNKLKEELLDHAVLVLTHQIEAAIDRLEALKDKNSAPANVDEILAKLNSMLETLEKEDITAAEVVDIAKEFRALWIEKHKQALIRVIKNMIAKLERIIKRGETLLEKASKLIDKLESEGLSEDKVAKLRTALNRFEEDLQWIKDKVEKAKQSYLKLDQELAPGEIHKIAVKANKLARIAHRKIMRHYAFIMRLAHLYRALQHKEDVEELMADLPEPAEVSEDELGEIEEMETETEVEEEGGAVETEVTEEVSETPTELEEGAETAGGTECTEALLEMHSCTYDATTNQVTVELENTGALELVGFQIKLEYADGSISETESSESLIPGGTLTLTIESETKPETVTVVASNCPNISVALQCEVISE